MPSHEERLDGGLVTICDPMLLQPGQLSSMKNLTYYPGSEAIHRALGRTSFGAASAAAGNVDGLRDMRFENTDHYLLVMVTGASVAEYRTASAAVTGTYNTLQTPITAGNQLHVTTYRNRHFLFNGVSVASPSAVGSNRAVYLSATANFSAPQIRQHGMLSVKDPPAVTTAAGSWSISDTGATGYYEYWTTEVAKLTQDGGEFVMESSFAGETPTTVQIPTTATVPVIEMPMTVNPITTHWRVYRSPKKTTTLAADRKYPTGFMIAEVAATGASAVSAVADTLTVASATSLPSLFNTTGFYGEFASASSLSSDNGTYASAVVPAGSTYTQGVYGFDLGGFTGNIRGIEVEVQGYVSSGTGPAQLRVEIGSPRNTSTGMFTGAFFDRSARNRFGKSAAPTSVKTASKSGTITSTNSASPTTLTLGSASDPWRITAPFVATDFTSAKFMVALSVFNNISVGIDYVKLKVYYAATVDSVTPYPTVVYTFGDITAQVGKNGPPPSSSTGDIFEDSLVVNDVDAPSIVRFSYPSDPEAFPPTYYVEFPDRVNCIKTVNNRCIVGLDTQLWRLNFLPSERDASFDPGKARDQISARYGIVNPMCACICSPTGGPSKLAFVSYQGIHWTDGFSFETLTEEIKWRNHISVTSTSTCISLVDDPENQCLIFFYRNDSHATETYMALRVHYDEPGSIRVSGPVHMRNYDSAAGGTYASVESAWSVQRSNGSTSIYLGYGGTSTAAGAGQVWIENGTTIPANDSTCSYSTRRMYLSGLDSEFRLDGLYGYAGTYTGSPALTYSSNVTKTNDAGPVAGASKSITLAGQKLHNVQFSQIAEGLIMTMQATASAFQQEKLILEGTGFGAEDSGR